MSRNCKTPQCPPHTSDGYQETAANMQLANHRGSNIHGIEPVGAGGKSSKLLNFFVQLLDNGLKTTKS